MKHIKINDLSVTVPADGDYNLSLRNGALLLTEAPPKAPVAGTAPDEVPRNSDLHEVAKSGSYDDLGDKPNFADVATSGSYTDLSDQPTYANVASSGSYNDLTDKPVYAAVAASGEYSDLQNPPSFSTVATSGNYNDLVNKPQIPDAAVIATEAEALAGTSDKVMSALRTKQAIDNAAPDLSPYAQSSDVNQALSTKADTSAVNQALRAKADSSYVNQALSGKSNSGHSHRIGNTSTVWSGNSSVVRLRKSQLPEGLYFLKTPLNYSPVFHISPSYHGLTIATGSVYEMQYNVVFRSVSGDITSMEFVCFTYGPDRNTTYAPSVIYEVKKLNII